MESVSSQICSAGFEHVIVDDGSSDGTYEKVESYSATHEHVKSYRMDQNGGTNAARNKAVNIASGKYILMLDSDDVIAPDSLQMICSEIVAHPDIRHFMFATDDRSDYYSKIGIAQGDNLVISFRELLEEKIDGDFAHVMLREIMLKYPFEEKLRTFEGVTFNSLFKEVQNILFVNTIVLLRDRSRNDHVSYSLIADRRVSIQRSAEACRLLVERFEQDYKVTEDGCRKMGDYLKKYHRFATLLGSRSEVAYCEAKLNALGIAVPRLYLLLNRFHCGPLFFSIARLYVKAKYRFWKNPVS